MQPSPTGDNGRDNNGRFAAGNHLAKGNPHAKRVNELRTALLEAVTPNDVRKIVTAMVKAAKAGDTVAAREVLDRTIGKAVQTELLQRVEELEQRICVYIPDNGRGPTNNWAAINNGQVR